MFYIDFMELVVLAGAVLVGFWVLLNRLRRLERRVAEAEKSLSALVGRFTPAGAVLPAAPVLVPDDTASSQVASVPPAAPSDTALPPPLPPDLPPARAEPAERPARSLEETIGSRWAIWVGGLAFALGGLFLVRYSIEAGLFSPAVRMGVATVAGLVALAGGEFIRRREGQPRFGTDRAAHVPAILTAAGLAILFGVAFAAHAVYGWVPSAVGFLLMGLVSLAAIALAIPHGTALAGLGLIGSFATPVLVASTEPNPFALFGFLSAVLVAAAALARLKDAAWVLVLGLAGTGIWVLLDGRFSPLPSPWASLLALAAMVAAMAGIWLSRRPAPENLGLAIAGRVGLPVFAGALIALVAALYGFGLQGLDVGAVRHAAGIAVLLLVAMALWRPGGIHGAPASALLLSGLLAGWMLTRFDVIGIVIDLFELQQGGRVVAIGAGPGEGAFLIYALGFGLPVFAAGLLMAWRLAGTRLTAMLWAFSAVLAPLVALGLAVGNYARWDEDFAYGPGALALAAILAAAAFSIWRREETGRPLLSASALLFLAAALPLGVAVHLLTTAAWTGIVLAILALGFAAWSARGGHAVFAWIAVLGAAAVLARFGLDPSVAGHGELSATPLLNWLTPGYFGPALAFAAAAWILRRTDAETPARLMEAFALTSAMAGAAMLVRHGMQGGVLSLEGPVTLGEQALYTILLLGVSLALVRLDDRAPSPVFRLASMALGLAGAATALVQHLVVLNPYFTNRFVGDWPLVNLVGAAYLLPGLMAALVAWQAVTRRPRVYVFAMACMGALMLFAWLNLEIRRFWQGPYIGDWKGASAGETYSYSAAWLVAGLALLAAGLRLDRQGLRAASGILVLLTVLKVFLFDMAELEGVLRAASFMGLGVCLIGIGLFYQRVLGRVRAPTVPAEGQGG